MPAVKNLGDISLPDFWYSGTSIIFNKSLDITNTVFFAPVKVKYMKKNLDITKNKVAEDWPNSYVKTRFHCIRLY